MQLLKSSLPAHRHKFLGPPLDTEPIRVLSYTVQLFLCGGPVDGRVCRVELYSCEINETK